ncbi:COG1470 family protein [Rhodococcus rhodochrous]|uniref:COG1470 family protein n=1 Tax=Rhodococcus rhodochrous TaxID=1829 RepID=UPI000E75E4F5
MGDGGTAAPVRNPIGQSDPAGAAAKSTGTHTEVPTVELRTDRLTLKPGEEGTLELQLYNNSSIVEGYTTELIDAPQWLSLSTPVISVYPRREQLVRLTFSIAPSMKVEAQETRTTVRVVSQTDTGTFVDLPIVVTVPKITGPLALRAVPSLVRLTDTTTGMVRLTVLNTESNYARRIDVAGSDPENVVVFDFAAPTVMVPPWQTADVDVHFETPQLGYSESTNRQLTFSGLEHESEDAPSTVAVTVAQQRSAAPPEVPLKVRLEPRVLRVRDCAIADLDVVLDNRGAPDERKVILSGRDTEGAVQFDFRTPTLVVAPDRQVATRVSVRATPPPPGEESARTIAVIASEGDVEWQGDGSFVQITSPPPITTAEIHLEPKQICRRNRSRGRSRLIVDNRKGASWLNVNVVGTDAEGRARCAFTPSHFEIAPGQTAWGWMDVSAPIPPGGTEVTRSLTISASDGRESVETEGAFVQSAADWRPIARIVLTVLGALLVAIGAFTPWMVRLPDYYVDRLPYIEQAGDFVEQTQPGARAVVLVLAAMMLFGVTGTSGKMTKAAAVLAVTAVIGYFVFVTTREATGGPMYGAVLVVVGSAIAFVGGWLARPGGGG